ncbi:MAG: glycosyltransferase [Desulfovibrio sp.]
MQIRPHRVQVVTEIGLRQSLPSGPGHFDRLGQGRQNLFLGLGPEPGKLAEYFPSVKEALYVECPDFGQQMPPEWKTAIPKGFTRIRPEELTPALARSCTTRRYLRNIRLFPSFWGPLWALCGLPRLADLPLPEKPVVWLPGEEADLLMRELDLAFRTQGYDVVRPKLDSEASSMDLPWKLTKEQPRLFFSVNFKGLDSFGGLYYLLRQAGARVAVWCVDNPFHLLTGIKSRYWTELDLFVTDDWFLEPLRALGAKSVRHLPLAACPPLFRDKDAPSAQGLEDRLVFVGRSEFPQKKEFFAGIQRDEALWTEARALLPQGVRPHFGWWLERLGIDPPWPGNEVRRAGFMAEETGRHWRALCLLAAGRETVVYGDDNWRALLETGVDVRPPVDYYGALPAVYARAAVSLNMTSPLLPHGLTQRHFDVWAAGGFLLTDETPGLNIFPPELVREITFKTPSDIPQLFARYQSPNARAALASAWRTLILEEHTYNQRVRKVLEVVGL